VRYSSVLIGLAAGAALLLAAAPQSGTRPFELKPLDEAEFTRIVAANHGKVVLFDFWATWCDPCRAELPQLVKLQEKYRSRGLVLLTVSADEPETAAAAADFLRKTGIAPPAFIKRVKNDEVFIDSIDKKWSGALPALFLYDRNGALSASFFGETETADLERAIGKVLQ